MFTNIVSIIFSILLIVFIKKVFYRQAALHPWVFSLLVYYPIMILWSVIFTLALNEAGPNLPNQIWFCGVFIAYFVFSGGKNTKKMADQHYTEKQITLSIQKRDDVKNMLRNLYSSDQDKLVNFSSFEITLTQLANAVCSLIYIKQVKPSNSLCKYAIDYLHDALTFITSSNFDPNDSAAIKSYLDFTRKKYFSGDFQWTLRSFKYVIQFNKNKDLIIGPHNIADLDE